MQIHIATKKSRVNYFFLGAFISKKKVFPNYLQRQMNATNPFKIFTKM